METAPPEDFIRAMLQRGRTVSAVLVGNSMLPTIKDGDAFTVAAVGAASLEPGDILMVQRGENCITHRVVSVSRSGSACQLFLKGDSNFRRDPVVDFSQVIGKVVAIESRRIDTPSERRKSRWIAKVSGLEATVYDFVRHSWIGQPIAGVLKRRLGWQNRFLQVWLFPGQCFKRVLSGRGR